MNYVVERLREWIDIDTKQLKKRGQEHLKGYDWFQLSPEEEFVFQMSIEDLPRVAAAYDAYGAIAGIVHNDLHGTQLCKDAMKEFDWIEQGHCNCHSFPVISG